MSIYPEGGPGEPPENAQSRGGPVAEARDKLSHAAGSLHEEAAQFVERAGDQIADQARDKKDAVSDALGVFADAIRKAGEDLGGQDQTFAAKVASQAADGLQAFSRNLAAKSPEDMLHAARDLGRDNPTALLAGAVLAGVAIGRFARSSSRHEGATTGPNDQTFSPGSELNFSPPPSTEPDHG